MNAQRASIVAASLLLFASLGTAADKQTPVEEFGLETAQSEYLCRMEASTAIAKSQIAQYEAKEPVNVYQVIGKCKAKAQDSAKPFLKKALTFAAKKPGATKAIKEYYIAWIASLDSLDVQSSDSQRSWDQRQERADQRTTELWSKVKLEMEF